VSFRSDLETLSRGWRWGRRRLVPASVEQPLSETEEFPTEWARSPAARAIRSAILSAGFAPLLRYEVDAKVLGVEVLEELAPPVLFAANHSSHLDAPLILTSLPPLWRKKTAVGGAADYFFDVWWRAVGTALAFNVFPVERGRSRRSAGQAGKLIEEGWSILVFPEGTRSKDGWIGEFRQGTARLSKRHGIPVIPISIRGSYQAMPRGRGWPAPGRPPVAVRFGRPVYPDAREPVERLNERIRRALAFGLEEDRTSWWGAMKEEANGGVTWGGPEGARWRRMWEASRPVKNPSGGKAWPK
jgi:1-acyl-sn-glycerol-3-phosphate acyltransferase